jgi:hypothetical protein
MQLDLKNISRKDFRVHERQHPVLGTLMLITPTPGKHRWELDELHLRSLLCKPDGTIVCSGFPKFRNYGEDESEGRMFEGYLENGEVSFAEKMDGSLIIRTVIDGHVNFRTRGSHKLADSFEERVMELVREKYPRLLSPIYRQGVSMLFEYTSPSNRIVLQYEDCSLTTLGLMNLYYDETLPKFFGFKHLADKIAAETGVDTLEFHDLTTDLPELRSEIAGWIGSEGIVAWCGDGAMLIKIKADEYIKIHSLKYHLTEDRVRKMAWFGNMDSIDDLKNRFFEMGLDWESVDFVREYMEDFLRDKAAIESEVTQFLLAVDKAGITQLPSRKRQALALKELASGDKRLLALGFKYIADDTVGVQNFTAAKVLKIPVNALPSAQK